MNAAVTLTDIRRGKRFVAWSARSADKRRANRRMRARLRLQVYQGAEAVSELDTRPTLTAWNVW